MTERTRSLKRRIVSKGFRGDRYADDRVYMEVDRARYWTEAYRQTDGLPEPIRRAKALANLLENMTIYIQEDELIVGNATRDPYSIPPTIELSDDAVRETVEDGYVREEDLEEIKEYMEYWKDKNMWARVREYGALTEDEIWIARTNFTAAAGTARDGLGSNQPDYDFVLSNGWGKILNRIEQKLKEAGKEMHVGSKTKELVEKVIEWKAMKIAVEAYMNWKRRYAKLAREIAKLTDDPLRKRELEQIAENCEHLATEPPATFWQAVQETWFIQLITHYLERYAQGTSVRIDQFLYPFYKRDKEAGRLTDEQAQEFIECLWVKLLSEGRTSTRVFREALQGIPQLMIYTIGGVKADGSPAENELTKIIMRATRELRTTLPSYGLRVHSKTPDDVLLEALENIKAGLAIPSFENDEVQIESLMHNFGATLEQARSWALILCKSPGPTGPWGTPRRRPFNSSAIGCLYLALNRGIYYPAKGIMASEKKPRWLADVPPEGIRLGPDTGDPREWKSMEDLYEAYRKQYHHCLKVGWKMRNVCYVIEGMYFQQPFLSACYEPCIEKGVDCMVNDELPVPWFNISGLVDTGDSFAAIKYWIFDKKKYTMEQLLEALRNNWEGYEEMRRDFINAPKWGNDDDYADMETKKAVEIASEEGRKFSDIWGGHPVPLPQAVSTFRQIGHITPATPNGRKDGEPLSDGGNSPFYGCDKKGPTAVLRSCAKLDYARTMRGCLLNQRFSPVVLEGEKGRKNWLAYMKTWHDLRVQHVQINVVDSDTLRAAQREPEKYTDLVVRVAGYSAYFVELDKETQDSIIARTEQILG